jgi:Purple acid Phosphatase, N-terminal domain
MIEGDTMLGSRSLLLSVFMPVLFVAACGSGASSPDGPGEVLDSGVQDSPAAESIADPLAPTINEVVAYDITATSARVRWELNEVATGYVEYGTSADYGSHTTHEESLKFDLHVQMLSGLQPATTYHFRVHSTNAAGLEATSGDETFCTLDEAGPANGWPPGTRDDLPMGGIFYGNPIEAGVNYANATIAVESSRRFRAERSGQVVSVRYQNRFVRPYEVDPGPEGRCAQTGTTWWCRCADNNLDQYECGYSMNSSYTVGNGGTIVVEVRPDDGNGLPSDTVLGKTESFVPLDNQDKPYPELEFESPVTLQAGATYHLVYTNLTPPTGICAKLGNLSLDEARACGSDHTVGAMGINGPRRVPNPSSLSAGPFRGVAPASLFRREADDDWKLYDQTLSTYELMYADGIAVGESYRGHDTTREGQGRRTVDGNAQVRQRFVVEDAERRVNGVWLAFGHGPDANGQPLSATLRDEAGEVLAVSSIEASQDCMDRARESEFLDVNCRAWGYGAFGDVVPLEIDKQYTIEFAAPSGAGFHLPSFITYASFGFRDRTYWQNAYAQYSSDGGSSWGNFSDDGPNASPTERDLAVLFTIEGMPTQLP